MIENVPSILLSECCSQIGNWLYDKLSTGSNSVNVIPKILIIISEYSAKYYEINILLETYLQPTDKFIHKVKHSN